jgi:threonyl-tRNA synthetase
MYFSVVENKNYAIKPMNCPGSILIYKERPRSYRELPLRLSEFGKVHRHELSGVLHGLFRVRAFTQDDAHIYCPLELVEQEILSNINVLMKVMKKCGFDSIKKIGISTRPTNAMGDLVLWEKATDALKNALNKAGLPYDIKEGEGAFYGPKIEFIIQDSMEREWQCGTIQVDFFQPENFDLSYVAAGGELKRPVIIHQALYGSLERFLGVLLEHHKGTLPFWLSPIQAKILTISSDQKEYAQTVLEALTKANIRAEIDDSSDTLSGQIKDAQEKRISWMIVIGKKEVSLNTVTLRLLDGSQEQGISIDELVKKAIKLTE